MKIIGQVFEEDNYSCFHRLSSNRDVLSDRVNKLIASISERYILNPIIVNERMEIIDGQGRFEARKALGRPIHYIISPGANDNDCRRMNKYNTRWTTLDFAKSYVKAGVSAYKLLLDVCGKTRLPIARVLRLSNRGTKGNKDTFAMSRYEKGELEFDEKDAEMVLRIKAKADEIADALQFSARRNDAFYTGVKVMSETTGYDHDKMIKNCKKQRSTYVQMSSLGDQLAEFERIYNYKTSANNKIYFSDYMRNRGANVRDYNATYSPYTDVDVSSLLHV